MLVRLRDQALVMERRELGEADRILVILCRDLGKVGAVAHSGRRSRRRFGGCLDLFARIDVELVDKGRGGLVCRSCGPGPRSQELGDTTLDLLRSLQVGDEPVRRDQAGMSIARSLLARLIDQHVGRPLKAREFLRNMAQELCDQVPAPPPPKD